MQYITGEKVICKCGNEAEQGYFTDGNYIWMGCDVCGIYVSAEDKDLLMKRWIAYQSNNHIKENTECSI